MLAEDAEVGRCCIVMWVMMMRLAVELGRVAVVG